MGLDVPKRVRRVLCALRGAGFDVFPVGGCVRDLVMGRRPQDWDAATSASPAEVAALFPGAVIKDGRLGAVLVPAGSGGVEVTTFRREGRYTDGRRPDDVELGGGLDSDAARRDFTVNAMYLLPDGTVFDPYGGLSDIDARLIRTVGDPVRRFSEDALRMLRAFHFSAQLGFEIEDRTLGAIRELSGMCASLSAERFRDETEKIIMSPRPQVLAGAIDSGVFTGRLDDVPGDIVRPLARIGGLPKNSALRWSAAAAVLSPPGGAETLLRGLRLDRKTVRLCAAAAEAARDIPSGASGIKRLIASLGDEGAVCACAAAEALYGGHPRRVLRSVLRSGEPCRISDLAVSAGDLLETGLSPGPEVGEVLNAMLEHVIEHPGDNTPEALLRLISGLKGLKDD